MTIREALEVLLEPFTPDLESEARAVVKAVLGTEADLLGESPLEHVEVWCKECGWSGNKSDLLVSGTLPADSECPKCRWDRLQFVY